MRLALLAMLSGCVPSSTPASIPDARMVRAVLAAWRAEGLPADMGRCDLTRATVKLTDERFRFYCQVPTTRANSCLVWESSGEMFDPERYPVIVVHSQTAFRPNGEPVIHELIHAASACALRNPDAYHTNPRAWAERGADTSVQARARAEILGEVE